MARFKENNKALQRCANWIFVFILVTCVLWQTSASAAQFVGGEQCRECHQTQAAGWAGSHHDLAMQVVNPATVLGDFENAHFEYNGIESLFYRKQDTYFVKTDGPDGEINEYEIKYVFGVEPLQQYLIEMDNGRVQVLGIAWDNRDQSAGGQRWFHIYAGESVDYTDPLHWTAPSQNWNHVCASCHSTNLKKNFDVDLGRFMTTYSEIDVSCEACHGPGSEHLQWAKVQNGHAVNHHGLLVDLDNGGPWLFEDAHPIAKKSESTGSVSEVETCARCHSRRSELWPDYQHGRALLDTHLPSLLDSRLYHPDGQIDDEVYVYGSFLQSKMYQKGVTCSDCHDAHSLQLKAEGNALCSQCHLANVYDSSKHHYHEMKTSGAQCINCHMTEKTYMLIDDRADHSFRVPRPDLSLEIGSPNACTLCHHDRDDEWAAAALEKWYEKKSANAERPHYGVIFHSAETGGVDTEKWLNDLAQDKDESSIVRATAVMHITQYPGPVTYPGLLGALHSDDPLIRVAAIPGLEYLPPAQVREYASSLLNDDLRIIRIEAARVLAGSRHLLEDQTKTVLDRSLNEYRDGLRANADRADSHVNLGNLYLRMDNIKMAETEFLKSIQMDSNFIPAYINLADLYRAASEEDKAERIINRGLDHHPQQAALHHARGLLKVRQKNISEALVSLKHAVELDPENTRYQYVYAIALYSSAQTDHALKVLVNAHQQRPSDRQVLSSLVTINSEIGKIGTARVYALRLFNLSPWDTGIQSFLEQTQ